MATTIITKFGSGAPTASDVVRGELAVDTENKRLYTEDSGGSVVEIGTNPTTLAVDTDTLVVDATNNRVGIGTDSPKTTLNLAADNSDQGPILTLENSDTSITTNDVVGQIDFYANDGSTGGTGQKATIQALAENSSGTSVGLSFGTSPFPNTTATEAMRIDSSGNVGIGTSSPDTLLHLSSDTGPTFRLERSNTNLSASDVVGAIEWEGRDATVGSAGVAGKIDVIAEDSTPEYAMRFFTHDNQAGTYVLEERMRITSDGLVGIGTDSPAGFLEINGGTGVATSGGTLIVRQDGDASTDGIALTSSDSTSHRIWKDGSGKLNIGPSNLPSSLVQDLSGNLLVGRTATSNANTDNGVELGGNGYIYSTRNATSSGNGEPQLILNRNDYDGAIVNIQRDGTTVASIASSGGGVHFNGVGLGLRMSGTAITPTDGSTGTEDATNDLGTSSARFKDLYLSGRVIANGVTTSAHAWSSESDSTSSSAHLYFRNPNGFVGNISTSGTATAYNTSSDYRLKENVVAMSGATERLKQLAPKRFNFIADADTTVDGFLAHEVADVVPEAVTGIKDAMRNEEYEVTPAVLDDDGNVVTEAVMGTRSVPDYQGIDQSKLVPLLVATIQELEARITQLEGAN